MGLNMAFDMESMVKESKDARLKFLEDQSMAALKVAVSHTPPWSQPRGKSEVNLPQMLSPGGSI